MIASKENIFPQKTNTKRIAVNTLALFARMFGIMIINLYAVRILLKGMGAEDYGTYNAIAGVVLTSGVITTTLAIAIQRFYSYNIGEKAYDKLQGIFSASMNIILVISLIIILLLETLGLWLTNNYLSIPADRLVAANWVFQFSLLTFLFGLIQLPYTAAIFAHEDMGIFALISFIECLLRLVVALLIIKSPIDALIFYGAGIFIVSCLTFLLYSFFARQRYAECHYMVVTEPGIYKRLISFSGWTMYSALAAIATTQGNTVLLNIFFGPITTAAFAISNQILHAFQALGNSIVLAFRPPMVKSYAEQNYSFLNYLFLANNKLTLYLLLLVSIPIATEIRTIFSWWLGKTPEETIILSRLCIMYIVCLTMNAPITIIVQATEKVKQYSLWTDTIILMCLPISFIAFQSGAPSYFSILTLIFVCIVAHGARMYCLYRLYPQYEMRRYILSVLMPGILIAVITTYIAFLLHRNIEGASTRFIVLFSVPPIILLMLVYLLGTTKEEKSQIYNLCLKTTKKWSRV